MLDQKLWLSFRKTVENRKIEYLNPYRVGFKEKYNKKGKLSLPVRFVNCQVTHLGAQKEDKLDLGVVQTRPQHPNAEVR